MKKTFVLVLCLVLAGAGLYSQELQTDTYVRENRPGDQSARISGAFSIPLRPGNDKMNTGGSISLGYDYYWSSTFILGGEATFLFNSSIGSNMLYCVPLLVNLTWQFTRDMLEIPCTLGLGYCLQSFCTSRYLGVDIRPQAGVYYRMNSEWSLGANVLAHIMPEWFPTRPQYNYLKVFGGLQASARYHF